VNTHPLPEVGVSAFSKNSMVNANKSGAAVAANDVSSLPAVSVSIGVAIPKQSQSSTTSTSVANIQVSTVPAVGGVAGERKRAENKESSTSTTCVATEQSRTGPVVVSVEQSQGWLAGWSAAQSDSASTVPVASEKSSKGLATVNVDQQNTDQGVGKVWKKRSMPNWLVEEIRAEREVASTAVKQTKRRERENDAALSVQNSPKKRMVTVTTPAQGEVQDKLQALREKVQAARKLKRNGGR